MRKLTLLALLAVGACAQANGNGHPVTVESLIKENALPDATNGNGHDGPTPISPEAAMAAWDASPEGWRKPGIVSGSGTVW